MTQKASHAPVKMHNSFKKAFAKKIESMVLSKQNLEIQRAVRQLQKLNNVSAMLIDLRHDHQEVAVIQGLPTHCRIMCSGMFGPCKVKIEYMLGGAWSYNVFASLSCESPDATNCDRRASGKPRIFNIHSTNDRQPFD